MPCQIAQGERVEDVFLVKAFVGQAGLNIAARLQALSLTILLIEKHARIGDNWRNRYRTLVMHDPINYTHMYGLPFPKDLASIHPQGQASRLVRSLREHHGAQRLAVMQPDINRILNAGQNLDGQGDMR